MLKHDPEMSLEASGDGPPPLERSSALPLSLLDLLCNFLVFDNVIPRLSLSSVFALSQTAKAYRSFVRQNHRFFRQVDLSCCQGAYTSPLLNHIDTGGQRWRAQRMDEHLTEDDIFSGPLRGVLSKLSRTVPLNLVHVLVLDGMASVTSDVVSELLSDSRYDVWILSLIGCINLSARKLQQLLGYLCRPGRPEGSPRLKGLYFFGTERRSSRKALTPIASATCMGVTSSEGAQLGSQSALTPSNPWYAPTGRVLSSAFARHSPWEETLQICKGIIAFDAVLCTHMHTDMAPFVHHASGEYLAEHKPTVAPLASVALGPSGCAGCGRAPPGAPLWGESDMMEFPLLYPPPSSGQIVDAVRPPPLSREHRLIVSCTWCLAKRHCENCNRWWCGACYNPQIQQLKVFNGLCVAHCFIREMLAGTGNGGMCG
jgi:hypothetical protein